MPDPSTGAGAALIATAPVLSWNGRAWRCHDARFPADSWDGILVPSASRLGSNVIVLPDNNTVTTRIAVTSWRDLRYVLRYQ